MFESGNHYEQMKKFLLISTLMIFAAIAAELFYRYPCNYGYNFRNHVCVLIYIFLISLTSREYMVITIMSSIAFVLIWLITYYNIGLDYETWYERGMPEWGEVRR